MVIGEKLTNINFNETALEQEYEDCTFSNCDFSSMQLCNIVFEDCTFEFCNFSLTKMDSSFRDVRFKECKMTGTSFLNMKDFSSLSFEKCHLEYASFMRTKLKRTKFVECNLNEVDFSESDLSMSVLKNCDLTSALFSNTNLEKADLTTSHNYIIDPRNNKIKKARFSKEGLIGLVLYLGIVIVD